MTLHLVLKTHWFDMIISGIKREEYRAIKPYWTKRLFCHPYRYVTFHRGYTNKTATFQIGPIKVGYGRTEWGAPENLVYIIGIRKEKTTHS